MRRRAEGVKGEVKGVGEDIVECYSGMAADRLLFHSLSASVLIVNVLVAVSRRGSTRRVVASTVAAWRCRHPPSSTSTALPLSLPHTNMPHFGDTSQRDLTVRAKGNTIPPSHSEEQAQRILVKNRRKRYLDLHPEYFSGSNLELAGGFYIHLSPIPSPSPTLPYRSTTVWQTYPPLPHPRRAREGRPGARLHRHLGSGFGEE